MHVSMLTCIISVKFFNNKECDYQIVLILSEILTSAEVSRTLRFASAWGGPTRFGRSTPDCSPVVRIGSRALGNARIDIPLADGMPATF